MQTANQIVPAVAGEHDEERNDARQYLTFSLAEETYGVDILRVQEIKGWSPATHVPNAPDHVLGVINLRGEILPVVDLRVRFGLAGVEYTPTTVVIVLRVKGKAGAQRTVGVVVDGVSDVFNIAADEIRPTPDFGTVVATEYIAGLATVGERMLMLLDIDALLELDELNDTAQNGD